MIIGITASAIPAVGSAPAYYRDLILSHSPLGYWRLGETSGTTAADSSGNGRNGTYTGTYTLNRPSLIPSDSANAAFGCQNTGYVQIATGSAFNLVGKTYLFSIYMTSLAEFSFIWHLGNYSVSDSQGLTAYINTNGTIALQYFNGSFINIIFTGFTASLNTAYRLGLKFNSSTSVSLIANGVVVDTQTAAFDFPSYSPESLRLGSGNNGGGALSALRGDIDEFAIIPSLLSDAQIAALEDAAT